VGVQGVQAQPQQFWFSQNLGKIPENPGKTDINLGKICENLRKLPENLGKLLENMGKNGAQCGLVWKYRRPTFAESIVLEIIPEKCLHEKIFAEKVARKFFGQVWRNLGKNPSHPPKFACSYTYESQHSAVVWLFVSKVRHEFWVSSDCFTIWWQSKVSPLQGFSRFTSANKTFSSKLASLNFTVILQQLPVLTANKLEDVWTRP